MFNFKFRLIALISSLSNVGWWPTPIFSPADGLIVAYLLDRLLPSRQFASLVLAPVFILSLITRERLFAVEVLSSFCLRFCNVGLCRRFGILFWFFIVKFVVGILLFFLFSTVKNLWCRYWKNSLRIKRLSFFLTVCLIVLCTFSFRGFDGLFWLVGRKQ